MEAEIERLRAQWHDSDPEKFCLENKALRAEIERLLAIPREIAGMEGEEGLTDHVFTERVLDLVRRELEEK